jgi:hypothetical protein
MERVCMQGRNPDVAGHGPRGTYLPESTMLDEFFAAHAALKVQRRHGLKALEMLLQPTPGRHMRSAYVTYSRRGCVTRV